MVPIGDNSLPGWVPDTVRVYLAHVVDGEPIRALARQMGCHASTVLRQVRRCEQRRDDPLIDLALKRLGRQQAGRVRSELTNGAVRTMNAAQTSLPEPELITAEARRVLRRLSEPGACLAVAQGMEKAVVVRETKDGQTIRTGVVDSAVAEAMALRDWIASSGAGKIARYRITPAGRIALNDLLSEENGTKDADDEEAQGGRAGPARYGVAETPLMTLARRRDKDGTLFLHEDLVRAGERLREDFELAQMGADASQDWDRYLTAQVDDGAGTNVSDIGPEAAQCRVKVALAELGPGLGDVVLRVCCYLEGLESVERRMGWAARSGKIVLRIGLQRLQRHYADTYGKFGPMIG